MFNIGNQAKRHSFIVDTKYNFLLSTESLFFDMRPLKHGIIQYEARYDRDKK